MARGRVAKETSHPAMNPEGEEVGDNPLERSKRVAADHVSNATMTQGHITVTYLTAAL